MRELLERLEALAESEGPLHEFKKIPGLGYRISGSSSFKYLRVIHLPSGKALVSLTSAPVKAPSKVAKAIEALLVRQFKGVDWTVSEEGLDQAKARQAHNAIMRLVRREGGDAYGGGRYTI